jgi:hypothetical protein
MRGHTCAQRGSLSVRDNEKQAEHTWCEGVTGGQRDVRKERRNPVGRAEGEREDGFLLQSCVRCFSISLIPSPTSDLFPSFCYPMRLCVCAMMSRERPCRVFYFLNLPTFFRLVKKFQTLIDITEYILSTFVITTLLPFCCHSMTAVGSLPSSTFKQLSLCNPLCLL